jgi:signal peptidase II
VLQLAVLVLLMDQFTKYLVIQSLSPGSSFPFRGFFRITHVHNTGSAFGILQGLNTPLIFVSFVGIVILVLIYRSQPHPSNWLRLSLALQLGGAFGNLIDRLRLGYVTDFIDIGPWPVFNLADASIVTGLVILAWVLTRSGPPRERSQRPEEQSAPVSAGNGPTGDERHDNLEYRNAVVPLPETPLPETSPPATPINETIAANDPEPIVGLTGEGQSEAPPTSPGDGVQRRAGPERLC